MRAVVLGMPFPLFAATVACLIAKENETCEVFTVVLTAILMQIDIKIKRSEFKAVSEHSELHNFKENLLSPY